MRDLSISSKKIIVSQMKVPGENPGDFTLRQVEIILDAPSAPQSMRIMMAYSMIETAQDAMQAVLEELSAEKEKFYEVLVVDGKPKRTRKRMSPEAAKTIQDECQRLNELALDADATLDLKRREFHRSCFSYVRSIRSLESKRPVLFDFHFERPKPWEEMTDDDKEILCTFDNTLAIDPIFQALRSGASVEELGK